MKLFYCVICFYIWHKQSSFKLLHFFAPVAESVNYLNGKVDVEFYKYIYHNDADIFFLQKKNSAYLKE